MFSDPNENAHYRHLGIPASSRNSAKSAGLAFSRRRRSLIRFQLFRLGRPLTACSQRSAPGSGALVAAIEKSHHRQPRFDQVYLADPRRSVADGFPPSRSISPRSEAQRAAARCPFEVIRRLAHRAGVWPGRGLEQAVSTCPSETPAPPAPRSGANIRTRYACPAPRSWAQNHAWPHAWAMRQGRPADRSQRGAHIGVFDPSVSSEFACRWPVSSLTSRKSVDEHAQPHLPSARVRPKIWGLSRGQGIQVIAIHVCGSSPPKPVRTGCPRSMFRDPTAHRVSSSPLTTRRTTSRERSFRSLRAVGLPGAAVGCRHSRVNHSGLRPGARADYLAGCRSGSHLWSFRPKPRRNALDISIETGVTATPRGRA